jgi:hypothetical protein
MRPFSTQGFQKLVDAAIMFEDDYRQVQDERKKRAKLEPRKFQTNKPSMNLSFKPRFRPGGNTSNPSPLNPRNKIICHNCGQPGHVKSECMKPKIVCYGCNQEGHIKMNCPNKPPGGWPAAGGRDFDGNNSGKRGRPFGKLNCTTLEEVGHSDQAVIGTLSILSHLGKVLFVYWSNYFFSFQAIHGAKWD